MKRERERENERREHLRVCVQEEEGTGAMDICEATEKIRSVVDRVFRARGARRSPKKKKLCRRAQPLYF